MRKILTSLVAFTALTTAASAADLPRRAAPPPPQVFTPVPVFTWTGFYLGVNAGYGFDASSRSTTNYALRRGTLDNSPDTDAVISVKDRNKNNGFSGGAQIGYNYQFTPGSGVVIGVEADAQYVDFARRTRITPDYGITGTPGFAFSAPYAYVATSGKGLDYFGTARGRLGYAFDRTLVYATGGYAYGSGQDDQTFAGRNFRNSFRTGYAVGGGVEYALPIDSALNFFRSSAVTLKVEGLYVNFDRQKKTASGTFIDSLLPPNGVAYLNGAAAKTEFAVVRAGLNYKFGSY
ncbi:porin family protein [Methylobacterium organophilum]|uniref:outer membrane protein n=1 Tax=Methylobacterium organophilum TaxID=410 RepID=UPI001F142A01|nr:porin family protein [Methylobacterium organophilum]UMY18351.1 porin family protein [Methylobacterium organophilum]